MWSGSLRRLAAASLLGVLLTAGCGVALAPDGARLTVLERELGSLVLVGFHGTDAADNPELSRLLCDLRVGGVLLLGRNIVDSDQLSRLTGALTAQASTCTGRKLLVAVDAEGALTALKHFPGHGSSFGDTHRGFTDVTDTAVPELELAPYRALIADGLADSVMTAHVFNRRLDDRYPATLSRPTIDGLLRGVLGFKGVVVSDDLRMGAIEKQYGIGEAAVLALDAGVDVLLIVEDRLPDGSSATQLALAAIREALAKGSLDPARVEAAVDRVRAFRARVR